MTEGTLVIDPARSLDAIGHALMQTIQSPLRKGDTDYRHLEVASFSHGIECREDHLVGKIARDSEKHERV
jgi:hypothetical protein